MQGDSEGTARAFLGQLDGEHVLSVVKTYRVHPAWLVFQVAFLIAGGTCMFPFWYLPWYWAPMPVFEGPGTWLWAVGVPCLLLFVCCLVASVKNVKETGYQFILTNFRVVETHDSKFFHREWDIARSKVATYRYTTERLNRRALGNPLLALAGCWAWLSIPAVGDALLDAMGPPGTPFFLIIAAVLGIAGLFAFMLFFFSEMDVRHGTVDLVGISVARRFRFGIVKDWMVFVKNYFDIFKAGAMVPDWDDFGQFPGTFFPRMTRDTSVGSNASLNLERLGFQDPLIARQGKGLNRMLWYDVIYRNFKGACLLVVSLVSPYMFQLIANALLGIPFDAGTIHPGVFFILVGGSIYVMIYAMVCLLMLSRLGSPDKNPVNAMFDKAHLIAAACMLVLALVSMNVSISSMLVPAADWIDGIGHVVWHVACSAACVGVFLGCMVGYDVLLLGICFAFASSKEGLVGADADKLSLHRKRELELFSGSNYFETRKDAREVTCHANRWIPTMESCTRGSHYRGIFTCLVMALLNIWLVHAFVMQGNPPITLELLVSLVLLVGIAEFTIVLRLFLSTRIIDDYTVSLTTAGVGLRASFFPRGARSFSLLAKNPGEFTRFDAVARGCHLASKTTREDGEIRLESFDHNPAGLKAAFSSNGSMFDETINAIVKRSTTCLFFNWIDGIVRSAKK